MIEVVIEGIGSDLHRVAWIEIRQRQGRHRRRLEIRSVCGMRVAPAGDLVRPRVGVVTCRFCLDGEQPGASFNVARCPEHGIHGRRDTCFECGGPVEQIEVVPTGRVDV